MIDGESNVANGKAPNWHDIQAKASKPQVWYLNDHVGGNPRFRIESTRGGQRTIWRERTSFKRMSDTKRYLESVWTR